jgi:hypothetical protein
MFPENIELYLLTTIIGFNIIINSIKHNYLNILVIILSSCVLFLLTRNITDTLVFSIFDYIIYKSSHNKYMEGYQTQELNIITNILR